MPKQIDRFDVAVIGAGIAGASVAAGLSAETRVVLLEQESQPGYHTTGRSAAVYSPIYGPQPIRALTRASLDFLSNPGQGFADTPLLSAIDAVFVAREDQRSSLDAMKAELCDASTVREMNGRQLKQRVPLLREGYAAAGLIDTGTSVIDVAALHQGYLRLFRALGGTLLTGAAVTGLARTSGEWRLQTRQGEIGAATVVNAAGAWAENIGKMAGAEQVGLVPKRRTAMIIEPPAGCSPGDLPLVIDVDEQFYLKPDAGRLLISPANEDAQLPCDVQPEELDIAICVDRIERAFELNVRRIENRWAGLRSFVADKSPLAGFSQKIAGFYWLAGQGGYGIQSAAGLAQFAAAEIMGRDCPQHISDQGLDPATLAPGRAGIGAASA